MLALFNAHQALIAQSLGRQASSALRVHLELQKKPVQTIPGLATSLSAPTVATAISKLQQLGIVEEVGQKARNRSFCYRPYLRLLDEQTDAGPADQASDAAGAVQGLTQGPPLS